MRIPPLGSRAADPGQGEGIPLGLRLSLETVRFSIGKAARSRSDWIDPASR